VEACVLLQSTVKKGMADAPCFVSHREGFWCPASSADLVSRPGLLGKPESVTIGGSHGGSLNSSQQGITWGPSSLGHHMGVPESVTTRYSSGQPVTTGTPSSPHDRVLVTSGCADWLCANCRSRWHTNLTCRQYQNLPANQKISEEDHATAEVLKQDGFQRCAACKMMVELEQGCFHMTCRYTHSL
jgi:hypothetical protein